MANIRLDLDAKPFTGQDLIFRSPVDCSDITGLIIYFPGESGAQTSQVFAFADAHGHNVGDLDLFAENSLVKIVVDIEHRKAYVQNPDTNDYLEKQFASKLSTKGGSLSGPLTLDSLILKRGVNYGTEQEMQALTNPKVGQLFFVLDE